ncbi:uncharacterized protein MELLADRAFT_88707 [Melampsora larici-populina 98AG31]|uniref:Uncharacterized protein n=1 Tax=Melampsora larici-populina (strain 98AG31 / pathotype 3-4-7) TaxID=747676 RepID=F4RSP8_MELLP|nr:uncharacterized protein MELLADRAFT_88707 [Melampsora larici-populina 98AG31]EGG04640.1 hypothetical protein MELLADRAFT_88707 [Melampsora larici-populina 98AG31]
MRIPPNHYLRLGAGSSRSKIPLTTMNQLDLCHQAAISCGSSHLTSPGEEHTNPPLPQPQLRASNIVPLSHSTFPHSQAVWSPDPDQSITTSTSYPVLNTHTQQTDKEVHLIVKKKRKRVKKEPPLPSPPTQAPDLFYNSEPVPLPESHPVHQSQDIQDTLKTSVGHDPLVDYELEPAPDSDCLPSPTLFPTTHTASTVVEPLTTNIYLSNTDQLSTIGEADKGDGSFLLESLLPPPLAHHRDENTPISPIQVSSKKAKVAIQVQGEAHLQRSARHNKTEVATDATSVCVPWRSAQTCVTKNVCTSYWNHHTLHFFLTVGLIQYNLFTGLPSTALAL